MGLLYLNTRQIYLRIDVKNPVSKKENVYWNSKILCKGCSYIFSAIVATINPTYSYKDEFGTRKVVPFSEKNKIPKGTDVKINKVNVCSERVQALVNGQDLGMEDPAQPIKIKPNFCQMNTDIPATEKQQKRVVKTLADEPGMSQLERLYNDVYDYQTGKFTGMSDAMRQEYNKDLATLYKAFTGKEEMPASVKSFADIQLRDFEALGGCQAEPNNQYMKSYEGTSKQKLFVDYANQIKVTMQQTEENRNALIAVLDKVFAFAVNPQTKKPEITINPGLNDTMLNELVRQTQELIIKLYTSCEANFIKGLEIFEQIIQEQIKIKTEKKIEALKNDLGNPDTIA